MSLVSVERKVSKMRILSLVLLPKCVVNASFRMVNSSRVLVLRLLGFRNGKKFPLNS